MFKLRPKEQIITENNYWISGIILFCMVVVNRIRRTANESILEKNVVVFKSIRCDFVWNIRRSPVVLQIRDNDKERKDH